MIRTITIGTISIQGFLVARKDNGQATVNTGQATFTGQLVGA